MGTETGIRHNAFCNFFSSFVKLNNPLMGTETNRPLLRQMYCLGKRVKLNNPLMGTETQAEEPIMSY